MTVCDVCGVRPAAISDGMCAADLCDSFSCFDAAWARAFGDDVSTSVSNDSLDL